MPIENDIQALTEAVKANTAAVLKLCSTATTPPAAEVKTKKEPKPAAVPEEKKAEPAAPALTVQDVRAAAQKVLDAQGVKFIRPLLTKYGVEKISQAPVEKYAEVIADLGDALQKAEAEAKEGAVV